MTFRTFIEAKADDGSPAGDVARDVLDDPSARHAQSYDEIYACLQGQGLPDHLLDLLHEAYEEYQDRQ